MKEDFNNLAKWVDSQTKNGQPVFLYPAFAGPIAVAVYATLPNQQVIILSPDGTWELSEYKGR